MRITEHHFIDVNVYCKTWNFLVTSTNSRK